MPKSVLVVCGVVMCAALHAQTTSPSFEVAVIKPSLPMSEAVPLLRAGKMKIGVSIGSGRVDMGFVTLTDILSKAFDVKSHQIAGPDWLTMERFDIQAKLPDGAKEDEVPVMIRKMLAERFGLQAHTESRTVAAYALVVGKNGAKLQPSTLPDDPDAARAPTGFTTSAGGATTSSGGPAGPTRMMMGPGGIQLALLRTKASGLADLLADLLGKPVVDRTGLAGVYQITLDVPQDDLQNVARALGFGVPGAATGAAADPAGSTMFQAVEQLGLKLDARRESIPTLVIDHVEKQPTAN
jgi:uncharacterized protein (TIGR03435 family)